MSGRNNCGGKSRKRGKSDNYGEKRELIIKDAEQEYGQVLKMLGNGRVRAMCFDGVDRLCHIRGKMRKKVWIGAGDIILVSLRDFQNEKADIIHKYNPDEVRTLRQMKEIPENYRISEMASSGDNAYADDIGFESDISEEGIDLSVL